MIVVTIWTDVRGDRWAVFTRVGLDEVIESRNRSKLFLLEHNGEPSNFWTDVECI